jgi:hypothetical protein
MGPSEIAYVRRLPSDITLFPTPYPRRLKTVGDRLISSDITYLRRSEAYVRRLQPSEILLFTVVPGPRSRALPRLARAPPHRAGPRPRPTVHPRAHLAARGAQGHQEQQRAPGRPHARQGRHLWARQDGPTTPSPRTSSAPRGTSHPSTWPTASSPPRWTCSPMGSSCSS